ncbi:hypothetical protein FQN57_000086 [Myotisia sp. PD_48]|nr:hypothetical protein FQN57_000086 [Myotisia sp. PD_48]
MATPQPNKRLRDTEANSHDAIVLHVLSPSFDAQTRITFDDLPLSTTIYEIKARITLALLSKPPPETQRLIYRGKPLSNNDEVLGKIVDPSDSLVHSMHLVLPPSIASQTSQITTNRSTTSHTTSSTNLLTSMHGLRCRTLPSSTNRSSRTPSTTHNLPPDSDNRAQLQQTRSHNQGQALPPPYAPILPLPVNLASSIHRSGSLSPIPGTDTSDSQYFSSPQTTQTEPLQNRSSRLCMSEYPRTAETLTQDSPAETQPNPNSADPPDSRRQMNLLIREIMHLEWQLQSSIIPRVVDISRIRAQLYRYLDEQHRNPLEPREVPVERWLSRLSNLASRADQLRTLRARHPEQSSYRRTSPRTPENPSDTAYMVMSPSGFRGVLAPGGRSVDVRQSRVNGANSTPTPTIPERFVTTGLPPDAVINQALNAGLLQQRNRHRLVIRGSTFIRAVRGFWLFIRLYFFCYILSTTGTWLRAALVTLAVVTALLSETDFPGRIQRTVLTPLQRHLEDLIPLEQPRANPIFRAGIPQAQQRDITTDAGHASRASQQQPPVSQSPDATPGVRAMFRGVERAIAIFVASLVPGISERHIAARNAAAAVEQGNNDSQQQPEPPNSGEENATAATNQAGSSEEEQQPVEHTEETGPPQEQ